MSSIDLNADLGEGAGSDTLLMPYLSSCNIACGVHAGDVDTIMETIRLAIQHDVKIGAHPSFPDRNNFGREEMELPPEKLKAILTDQIKLVKDIAENQGVFLHHVKPHGALYNMAAMREDIAKTIVSVMTQFASVLLYAPFNSVISTLARKEGIKVCYEVFADRNYNEDLSLVSRREKNAMLNDPNAIAAHVIRMIKDNEVKTIKGNRVAIHSDTVCIHGDNAHAVDIAKLLRSKLKDAGIEIS